MIPRRPEPGTKRIVMSAVLRTGFIFLLTTGCGGGDGVTDPKPTVAPTPGAFALSQASGFGNASLRATPVRPDTRQPRAAESLSRMAGPSFDLGAIKATDEFFFLLSNSGGTSITGITIVSNNPAFEISPTQISELQPDTGTGSVTPIVRVTAVHGLATSGLGFAALLAAGTNSAVIDFTGTTTDSTGASLPVALDATVSVEAMLVDIRLTDDNGVVDETVTNGTGLGLPEAGGSGVPVVNVQGDILWENTGNVPFDRIVTGVGVVETLAPGQSTVLAAAPGGLQWLILDGGGTVSDQTRLPILPNGLIILGLQGL